MTRLKPRVVYLSSTELGHRLLAWLRALPCEIVLAGTENERVTNYPQYDLGISFLYTHRVPKGEFSIPYRWINFHPGPLPELRGRNLAYHAILERNSHFGATVHYMDAEFDTGEIIEVDRFEIEPYHTAGDLVAIAHSRLEGLFTKYVPRFLAGRVPSQPQGNGKYYRRSEISDQVEITEDQARLIRAITVDPKYHARIEIGGRRYKIVPANEE